MLYTGIQLGAPVAIRYPRLEGLGVSLSDTFSPLPIGKMACLKNGKDVNIIGLGPMVELAQQVAANLETDSICAGVINGRFVKPLDTELLDQLAESGLPIIIIEEHALQGGFGSAILEYYEQTDRQNLPVKRFGIPDDFIEHGSRNELLQQINLTADDIADEIRKMVSLKDRHIVAASK